MSPSPSGTRGAGVRVRHAVAEAREAAGLRVGKRSASPHRRHCRAPKGRRATRRRSRRASRKGKGPVRPRRTERDSARSAAVLDDRRQSRCCSKPLCAVGRPRSRPPTCIPASPAGSSKPACVVTCAVPTTTHAVRKELQSKGLPADEHLRHLLRGGRHFGGPLHPRRQAAAPAHSRGLPSKNVLRVFSNGSPPSRAVTLPREKAFYIWKIEARFLHFGAQRGTKRPFLRRRRARAPISNRQD